MGKKLYGKVFHIHGELLRLYGRLFRISGKAFHEVFSPSLLFSVRKHEKFVNKSSRKYDK